MDARRGADTPRLRDLGEFGRLHVLYGTHGAEIEGADIVAGAGCAACDKGQDRQRKGAYGSQRRPITGHAAKQRRRRMSVIDVLDTRY